MSLKTDQTLARSLSQTYFMDSMVKDDQTLSL